MNPPRHDTVLSSFHHNLLKSYGRIPLFLARNHAPRVGRKSIWRMADGSLRQAQGKRIIGRKGQIAFGHRILELRHLRALRRGGKGDEIEVGVGTGGPFHAGAIDHTRRRREGIGARARGSASMTNAGAGYQSMFAKKACCGLRSAITAGPRAHRYPSIHGRR
jgi:hypothetical protein